MTPKPIRKLSWEIDVWSDGAMGIEFFNPGSGISSYVRFPSGTAAEFLKDVNKEWKGRTTIRARRLAKERNRG